MPGTGMMPQTHERDQGSRDEAERTGQIVEPVSFVRDRVRCESRLEREAVCQRRLFRHGVTIPRPLHRLRDEAKASVELVARAAETRRGKGQP